MTWLNDRQRNMIERLFTMQATTIHDIDLGTLKALERRGLAEREEGRVFLTMQGVGYAIGARDVGELLRRACVRGRRARR
jgi:hypothetical protein